jgi:PAS domain-containing protein
VLESITDAFCVIDRQWRFTWLNGDAERVLRRSRDELLRRTLWGGGHFEEYYAPPSVSMEVRAYPSSAGLRSVYTT